MAQLNVAVAESMKREAKVYAARIGISLQAFVRIAIEEALRKRVK